MSEIVKEWMLDDKTIIEVCKLAYNGMREKERTYWDGKLSCVLSPCKESSPDDVLEVREAVAYALDFAGSKEINAINFKIFEETISGESAPAGSLSWKEMLHMTFQKENGELVWFDDETIAKEEHKIEFLRGYMVSFLSKNRPLDMTETERVEILQRHGDPVDEVLKEIQLDIARHKDELFEKRIAEEFPDPEDIANTPAESPADTAVVPAEMVPLAIDKAERAGYLKFNGTKYVNQKDSMQGLVLVLWRKYGHDMPTQSDVRNWVVSKKGKPYAKNTVSTAFKRGCIE